MNKTVSIEQLVIGMCVQKIIKSKKNFNINNLLWIRSQEDILNLKKAGVELVEIAPEKSTNLNARKDIPAFKKNNQPIKYLPTKPLEQELQVAKQIYLDAHQMQKKTFADLKKGQKLSIKEFEGLSSNIVDSLLRNPDSLAILTRLRVGDDYLFEHSMRVGILLGVFGTFLGFSEEIIQQLVLGGLIHDLGKIKVPPEILNKPGKLTDYEFCLVKGHVLHGRDLIRDARVQLSETAFCVLMQHHETLDKKGYPYQLASKEITRIGRMSAIVDIFDALISERTYKKGLMPAAALSILKSMAPDKLDKDLVDSFISCIRIYPVGCLVLLQSKRLGIVYEHHATSSIKPIIKLIYDLNTNSHIVNTLLDLSCATANDKIVTAEKPSKYGLNLQDYF